MRLLIFLTKHWRRRKLAIWLLHATTHLLHWHWLVALEVHIVALLAIWTLDEALSLILWSFEVGILHIVWTMTILGVESILLSAHLWIFWHIL